MAFFADTQTTMSIILYWLFVHFNEFSFGTYNRLLLPWIVTIEGQEMMFIQFLEEKEQETQDEFDVNFYIVVARRIFLNDRKGVKEYQTIFCII